MEGVKEALLGTLEQAAEAAPVRIGSVFATLVQEMSELTNELAARRRFDADFVQWLKEFGFAKDFEDWRALHKPRPALDPGAL